MNPADRCYLPYPPAAVANAANGPLQGLRFAVKDIYDVAGYPTGCGNPHALAASGIKTRSAPVVEALLAAGAVFTGKVITDELAFSLNGRNAHFGAPINGAAPERITGGSSSGSASAVSLGLCDFALGSDTGGSVRAPASHCGLIGLRPTHDRISLEGCMPLAPGFDTCGWFARDIGVFQRVGALLLGEDTHSLPEQPRLLVPADVVDDLSAPVRAAFSQALAGAEALGLPSAQPTQVHLLPRDALYWAFRHLQGWEAWQSHGDFIERHGLQLGPGVKERFDWSSQLTPAQVAPHRAAQARFADALAALLGDDGVLVMPTMPGPAPLCSADEAGLEDYRNQATCMLCLAGLAGLPQISLPLLRVDGAPLGLSLIGGRGSDRALIALAVRFMGR